MPADGPVRLKVREPGGAEREVQLEGEVLRMGRARDCELPLDSGYISRYHARIEWAAGIWQLTDEGSKNGVILNGKRLSGSHPLYPGDNIRLGDFSIVFELEQEPDYERTVAFPMGRYAIADAEGPSGREAALESAQEPEPEPALPRGFAVDPVAHTFTVDGMLLEGELNTSESAALGVLADEETPHPAVEVGNSVWGPGGWDTPMLERFIARLDRRLTADTALSVHIVEKADAGYALTRGQ